MKNKPTFRFSKIIFWVFMIVLLILALYPLFWMIMSSFKTNSDFTVNRFGFPSEFTLENYSAALEEGDFGRYFINSGILSALSLVIMVFSASMTAFSFARYRFKASKPLLAYFMVGQMLSAQIMLIAVYLIMVSLNLVDSIFGLSLVYAASGLPFTIFLLQAFFRTLPNELYEAAEVDGYNDWMIFLRIALPLVMPGLSTALVIQFMYVWNEFPLAMIVINSPENLTLPVAIYRIVNNMYYSNYAQACAGLCISAIPVLIIYAVFQKKIIGGMTAGAVKG